METNDFFEMLKRSLLSKCSLMRDYPLMYAFSLRAYYETDSEIKSAIQDNYILPKAGHDFPMRNSKELNAVLNDFLLGKIMHSLLTLESLYQ